MTITDSKNNEVARIAGTVMRMKNIESLFLTGSDFTLVVKCNQEEFMFTSKDGKIEYERTEQQPTDGEEKTGDVSSTEEGKGGTNDETTEPTSYIKGK